MSLPPRVTKFSDGEGEGVDTSWPLCAEEPLHDAHIWTCGHLSCSGHGSSWRLQPCYHLSTWHSTACPPHPLSDWSVLR